MFCQTIVGNTPLFDAPFMTPRGLPATLWINGELCPGREARISPFDQGFLSGHGVFETLLARRGVPLAVTRHWKRLCHSCDMFQLPPPSLDTFRSALEQVLQASGLEEARLRFTVTGGEAAGFAEVGAAVTQVATAQPLPPRQAAAQVAVTPWRRNAHSPLAGVKSTSYAENTLALRWARERGADEGLFTTHHGEICEGTTSNVFAEVKGRYVTPPLSSGCLPGVTRGLVLEYAQRHGLPVAEEALPLENFRRADAAFLTSSLREMQPISHIDGETLSQSPSSSLGRQLVELFHQMLHQNADP